MDVGRFLLHPMSAQFSVTQNRDDKRTLVVVFLRGAADGLTLVAPLGDDNSAGFARVSQ